MKAFIKVFPFAIALLGGVITLSGPDATSAHVTVISPFTYHRHVAPILERRCGSCHGDGGVAPQTFGTYQEARAQAVAMRHSLMSGRMPPWSGQSGLTALQEQSSLTARELDMLMTWSAGGTPEGPPVERVEVGQAVRPVPDAVVAMPEPYVFSGLTSEADHEIELPLSDLAGRWIRAATVVPQHAAIVRRAEIAIRSKDGDQVIGLWLPGEIGQEAAAKGAFQVPPDGRLRLRLHYRHPQPTQATDVTDRSSVALYFAKTVASQIRTLQIPEGRLVVTRASNAVGFRITDAPPGAVIIVTVTPPQSRGSMLLRFTHRPEWRRRYLFGSPIALQPGTIVDVRATTAALFSAPSPTSVLEVVE